MRSAVPQLQPALQVARLGQRGAVVGAHRHTHRAVIALVKSHGQAEAGRIAVSCDDDGCRVHPAVGSPDAADTVIGGKDRLGDIGSFDEGDALGLGVAGQPLVENGATADHAEVRVIGELGPGKDEGGDASTMNPQPLGVLPAGLLGDIDPQPDELLDGTRGEAVTADLVAWEGRLLQQGDVQSSTGKVRSCGRATRPSTDDDDVGLDLARHVGPSYENHGIVPGSRRCASVSLDGVTRGKLRPGPESHPFSIPRTVNTPRPAVDSTYHTARARLSCEGDPQSRFHASTRPHRLDSGPRPTRELHDTQRLGVFPSPQLRHGRPERDHPVRDRLPHCRRRLVGGSL